MAQEITITCNKLLAIRMMVMQLTNMNTCLYINAIFAEMSMIDNMR